MVKLNAFNSRGFLAHLLFDNLINRLNLNSVCEQFKWLFILIELKLSGAHIVIHFEYFHVALLTQKISMHCASLSYSSGLS